MGVHKTVRETTEGTGMPGNRESLAEVNPECYASAQMVISAKGSHNTGSRPLGGDTEEQDVALALKQLASHQARGVVTNGYAEGFDGAPWGGGGEGQRNQGTDSRSRVWRSGV